MILNRLFPALLILLVCTNSTGSNASDNDQYKTLINEIYEEISGFNVPSQEYDFITHAGGAPTYGEITFEGAKKLAQILDITENDVFYDLGCGVGKLVMQVYLTTPVKKSMGIELSKTRIDGAKKALKELKERGKIEKGRKLIFKEGDIVKANIKDATAVFISSLCFSDELMQKLTDKLAKLKKGLRVATSRELKPHEALKSLGSHNIPMSWSSASTVYVYERV